VGAKMRLTGVMNGREWLITNKSQRYGRIPLTKGQIIARIQGEPKVMILGSVEEARAYIKRVLK
jgi:hypothetical protein